MAQISGKKVRKRVRQLERFLIKKYKKQVDVNERDWKKYEREFKRRLRKAVRVLPRMIRETCLIYDSANPVPPSKHGKNLNS